MLNFDGGATTDVKCEQAFNYGLLLTVLNNVFVGSTFMSTKNMSDQERFAFFINFYQSFSIMTHQAKLCLMYWTNHSMRIANLIFRCSCCPHFICFKLRRNNHLRFYLSLLIIKSASIVSCQKNFLLFTTYNFTTHTQFEVLV